MAEPSREDWEQYREFSRSVLGYDPGPRPDGSVEVDQRRVRKEQRSMRSTLSKELAQMFGVPVEEMQDGESVEATQIATDEGLFIPWDDLRENGDRRRD